MEHLDSAENMEKVTALAGELKIAGYENARPEQKAEIARTLDFLYARRDEPETRRKLMSLLEFISKPLPGAPAEKTGFDLHAHLASLADMIEAGDGAAFYRSLQREDEPLNRGLNVKELWRSSKLLPAEAHADKIKTAEEIFARLCAADGKINRRLKELNERCPVSFAVVGSADKDGECRMVNDQNGRGCVVSLNEGAFGDRRLLPMLIAHELGHYVDGAGRPADFRGHLPENQEYTADILGAEMALNAGYKVTSFSRELKSKNSAFLQKRGNALEKFQQIYQKNDLERRLSELPNTPAGRQVRAFIGEVEAFWDRWEKEKKQADRHYAILSEEQKLSIVLAEMEKQKDCAGLSAAEKMAKLDEKTERHREQEKKFSGRELSPEEARESFFENVVKAHLYNQLAVMRINSRFNPYFDPAQNKGYCTASVMECLRRSARSGELDAVFNTDPERLAHPASLFKHLMETEGGKYAGHIRRSGDDGCRDVQEIIDRNGIKPGALICLTMDPEAERNPSLEGSHNHLMIYAGKDKSGEHCFYGFNNDIKDGKLKNHNFGYVLDSYGLFADMIRDYHRVYVRGGYIEAGEQGIECGRTNAAVQTTANVPVAGKAPARESGGR